MEEDMSVSSESEDEVIDPAHAAAAAELITELAGPLQATKELKIKEVTPPVPPSLEDSILKSINSGGGVFLNQKKNFAALPASVLERMSREFDQRWRQPPLANMLANSQSRHLSLHLKPRSQVKHTSPGLQLSLCGDCRRFHGLIGWTLQDLDTLCNHIVSNCEYTLQSLDIENPEEPRGSHPGLTVAQLCSLVQGLHGLVTLHLRGSFLVREVRAIICALASSNPGIRHLRVPCLNTDGLNAITDSWPQLESLDAERTLFNSAHLAAALLRLTNLRHLKMDDESKKMRALLHVVRAHDPASPPYPMEFDDHVFFSSLNTEPGSDDVSKLFAAFPGIHKVYLECESDVSALCTALETNSDIRITRVCIDTNWLSPHTLEPLLAVVGKHLLDLEMLLDESHGSTLDLNMLGHYCPQLETLGASCVTLLADDIFKERVNEAHYFSKLKIFGVVQADSENSPAAQLPVQVLSRILASPHLKRFYSNVYISEEVAASVFAACGEQGALGSLRELILHPGRVSTQVVAELVSRAPRLEYLCLNSRGGEGASVDVLAAFLRLSNLHCYLAKNVEEW